jgi:uncharacterized membrane protein
MSPQFERYLADLEAALSRLEPAQRKDTLREIESHFTDASGAGAREDEVIARLGPPRLLAAALVAETLDKRHETRAMKAWRVLVSSVFITGASFTTVMVVPLLAATALGFGLSAVLSPVFGVIRSFGATWIQINMGPGRSLPVEWSIPFTLGLAIVCAGIALGAYKLLRFYLRLVARGYRAVFTGVNGARSVA